MDEKKTVTTTLDISLIGLGFIVSLVFMILKLMGVIAWSWFWVAFPLMVGVALTLAILIIVLLIALVVCIVTAIICNRF
jgi:hypothetical protein